jgi:hypothetical protein
MTNKTIIPVATATPAPITAKSTVLLFLDLLLLAMSASLLLTGAGRMSIEWKIGKMFIPRHDSGIDP